ncbi:MAG: hypothetical protein HQL02_08480 [Nitrospirae bacterium]|nr:hypothetical protein [Nitrospirota bacterium]
MIERQEIRAMDTMLFVTSANVSNDEGIVYAIELAINTRAALEIVIVCCADSFAQCVKNHPEITDRIQDITSNSHKYNLNVTCEIYTGNVTRAIKDRVARRNDIKLVILGTGLSKKSVLDAKYILRDMAHAVVTLQQTN